MSKIYDPPLLWIWDSKRTKILSSLFGESSFSKWFDFFASYIFFYIRSENWWISRWNDLWTFLSFFCKTVYMLFLVIFICIQGFLRRFTCLLRQFCVFAAVWKNWTLDHFYILRPPPTFHHHRNHRHCLLRRHCHLNHHHYHHRNHHDKLSSSSSSPS
jgi:hypothetical protein